MREVILRENSGQTISVLGDRQTFKLTGKETDGKLTVILHELPPGIGVPMHVHTHEDETFYLTEGELEVTIDSNIITLKAGDVILLPKNVPHAIKNNTDRLAKAHLSLYPAGIEEMFMELSKLPAGPPNLAQVSEICNRYGVRFV